GVLMLFIIPNLDIGLRVWDSSTAESQAVQMVRVAMEMALRDIRRAERITEASGERIDLIVGGRQVSYGLFDVEGEPFFCLAADGELHELAGPLDGFEMRFYDEEGNPTARPDRIDSVEIRLAVEGKEFLSSTRRSIGEEIVAEDSIPFTPWAVTAGRGGVYLGGLISVRGSRGSVVSNGDITISGGVFIQGDVITAGECHIIGHPRIGGRIEEGADPIDIPRIDIESLRPLADYILASDGKAYDRFGRIVGNGRFRAWRFRRGRWVIEPWLPFPPIPLGLKRAIPIIPFPGRGNPFIECDGFFFAETDVSITGLFRGRMTVITPGDVTLFAVRRLSSISDEGYLIIAGGDANIGPSGRLRGLIYGSKIEVSAVQRIEGALVGERVEVKLSGNVRFEGEYEMPGGARLRFEVVGWDEG
ncbi:hypothetical protein DRP77_00305, partial [Candidatus Poribacteria bacterium]